MSDPYIGEIRMFGGNFAPVGWLLCQGQLVSIADYDTLFNLIGTTYGGDGINTFGLPNLQSRIPVHQGQNYPLGLTGGTELVTLTTAQLPVHTHQAAANNQTSSAPGPANGFWGTWVQSSYSATAPAVQMNPAAIGASGGSQPHDNMPPFLAINFIISMYGIYPSPS